MPWESATPMDPTKKSCPLKSLTTRKTEGAVTTVERVDVPCSEGRCAWWCIDSPHGRCAMVQIADTLLAGDHPVPPEAMEADR